MKRHNRNKTSAAEWKRLCKRVDELEQLERRHSSHAATNQGEQSLLFAVFDSLPAFIYLQAKDYSIRFANRAFRDRFGEPGTRRCYNVISGLDRPCPKCPTFRVFETRQPQTWEWQPNRVQTFQIYDYPFFDTDGTALVLELGVDISAAKNLENARNQLFANVSHELRTPLMKIQGYVEALRDGFYTDPADFRKQLDIIHNNTQRVNRLIDDLLDLAKLNAYQSFQFKVLPINEVLLDYIAELEPYLRNKQRHLTYSLPESSLKVKIDPERFIQVMDNLIDNSVKHTLSHGLIHIEVMIVANGIQFSISDNGPGIAREDIPHIFSKFYRGHRKIGDDMPEGLGLGLSIVHSIVEAHGGRIQVESEQSVGARISFVLPLPSGEVMPKGTVHLLHGEVMEHEAEDSETLKR